MIKHVHKRAMYYSRNFSKFKMLSKKKCKIPILCLRGNHLQIYSPVHILSMKQHLKWLQMLHSPGVQPLVWSPFPYVWIDASDLFLMNEILQKW